MDTVISEERLRSIYDSSLRLVLERTAGIQLREDAAALGGEVYTVYTSFERGLRFGVAVCAESGLFLRMAQRTLRRDRLDFRDVEAFAKESLNMVCGHVAVTLSREAKLSVRFQLPAFYPGRYQPMDRQAGWDLQFRSDGDESLQLIHYNAPADGAERH